MRALISTLDPRANGYRVAQVASQDFPVAVGLFWVDCSDDVVSDLWYYDPEDQTIKEIPVVTVNQPSTTGSQNL
jgi:hypothetical protein